MTFPGGNAIAFVTRIDASGASLLFSTFLGGTDGRGNPAFALALDSTGAATICGQTWSADFPTTQGAFQSSPAGSGINAADAFVTRLDLSGALWYSTYLGGSGLDRANGIALDPTGAATVCGQTASPDFPTSSGAFQTAYGGGGGDAFVTRIGPSGGALLYSTYLGGWFYDLAVDVALDASGAATVCGDADSNHFPTTPGAFMPGSGWRLTDAFVARLDPSGGALLYSTFLGGSGNEHAHALAIDLTGAATVCGHTASQDFPTSSGAFQTLNGGSLHEQFVARLDPSGGTLLYSTYLGGSGADWTSDLALDATGVVTVCGQTQSPDFPTTPGAFQPSLSGGQSAFVTQLDRSGRALLYSTYLGGSAFDRANAVTLDAAGTATVFGKTFSSDFPTTPGAGQSNSPVQSWAGLWFLTRLDLTGPGQCNSAAASLTLNGAGTGAHGPILAGVASVGSLTLDWGGPPNQPTLLFVGPANPAHVNLGCTGLLDIGTPPTYSDVALLFDGTLPGYPHSLFALSPAGTAQQTFTIPALPSGPLATVQGVVMQPASTCPFVLTAAFSVVVY